MQKKKWGKALLGWIMCLVLCVGYMPAVAEAKDAPTGVWSDYAASAFAGGSGTAADPWQITTPEQLAKLAADINSGVVSESHSNEHFVLTADIDLSAHRWIPIGSGDSTKSFHAFCGYFDGNNKTITGLYVDESQEKYSAGLFGNFTGRELKNLTVSDGYVKTECDSDSKQSAGILIGSATQGYGVTISVTNCKVSGTVESGSARTGGFMGYNSYGTYENCSANVEVKGYGVSGGFVGEDFSGTYRNCTAKGTVNGSWSVGGFAGILFFESKAETCAAFGKVTASDWNAGGFAGYVEQGVQIKNSVAFGDVESTVDGWAPKAGGFAGTIDGNSEAVSVANSHAAGKVSIKSGDAVGGFVAAQPGNQTLTGNSFDQEKNPKLAASPDKELGAEQVQAGTTAEVLANICEDYYGGHEWDENMTVDKKPTCTEPGEKSFHCKRCDISGEKLPLDPTGHELKLVKEKPATCTEDGTTEYWLCETCHKMFADEAAEKEISAPEIIKAKGHTFGEWKVTKQPTKTAKGEKQRVCKVCSYTEKQEIPALGGTDNKTDAKKNAAKIPVTGDSNSPWLWVGLVVLSLAVVIALVVVQAKKKRK